MIKKALLQPCRALSRSMMRGKGSKGVPRRLRAGKAATFENALLGQSKARKGNLFGSEKGL